MDEIQAVALGRATADLVVRGGAVLLPGAGDFTERDVLVRGDRIAAAVEDGEDAVGPETTVVEADGRWVVPGFVDAHTHLDVRQTYEAAYHRSLAGGTTSVVTEIQDLGGVFGADAVESLLSATADLPVTVYATVPPQPLSDTFGPVRADEAEVERLLALLDRDRVVGVGEIDWIHVVGRDSLIHALVERARETGARIAAHGAGCSGGKLSALASVVDNDHEAISAEGIVERVENGIHTIGRSGAIRDDVEAVAAAHGRVDPAELSLCSDGVSPRDWIEDGHMDAVLRRAIAAGLPPVDAIDMATRVPARHYGLACGAIAPGRPADVVVLSDLASVRVETVVSGGEVVVRDGSPLVGPRAHEYPPTFYESADVRIGPGRFRVPDPGGPVRAIRPEGPLLTSEATVEPPVEDGALLADPSRDLCKATLIDRHPRGNGGGFTGFLTGLGVARGAVATTQTWEVPGLLVVGTDDDEMRRAARRVVALRGGWAVVDDGEVIADLPLSVGGFCSELPLAETAERYDALAEAVRSLGAAGERPILTIQTLTFPGVPALKLAFPGYADIRARTVVGLSAE